MSGAVLKSWAAAIKDMQSLVNMPAAATTEVELVRQHILARLLRLRTAKSETHSAFKRLVQDLQAPHKLATVFAQAVQQHPRTMTLQLTTHALHQLLGAAGSLGSMRAQSQLALSTREQLQAAGLMQHLATLITDLAEQLTALAVEVAYSGISTSNACVCCHGSLEERWLFARQHAMIALGVFGYAASLWPCEGHTRWAAGLQAAPAVVRLALAAYRAIGRTGPAHQQGYPHGSQHQEAQPPVLPPQSRLQQQSQPRQSPASPQQQQQQQQQSYIAASQGMTFDEASTGMLSTAHWATVVVTVSLKYSTEAAASGQPYTPELSDRTHDMLMSPDFVSCVALMLSTTALGVQTQQLPGSQTVNTTTKTGNSSSSSSAGGSSSSSGNGHSMISHQCHQLFKLLGQGGCSVQYAVQLAASSSEHMDLDVLAMFTTQFSHLVRYQVMNAAWVKPADMHSLVDMDTLLSLLLLHWADSIPADSPAWPDASKTASTVCCKALYILGREVDDLAGVTHPRFALQAVRTKNAEQLLPSPQQQQQQQEQSLGELHPPLAPQQQLSALEQVRLVPSRAFLSEAVPLLVKWCTRQLQLLQQEAVVQQQQQQQQQGAAAAGAAGNAARASLPAAGPQQLSSTTSGGSGSSGSCGSSSSVRQTDEKQQQQISHIRAALCQWTLQLTTMLCSCTLAPPPAAVPSGETGSSPPGASMITETPPPPAAAAAAADAAAAAADAVTAAAAAPELPVVSVPAGGALCQRDVFGAHGQGLLNVLEGMLRETAATLAGGGAVDLEGLTTIASILDSLQAIHAALSPLVLLTSTAEVQPRLLQPLCSLYCSLLKYIEAVPWGTTVYSPAQRVYTCGMAAIAAGYLLGRHVQSFPEQQQQQPQQQNGDTTSGVAGGNVPPLSSPSPAAAAAAAAAVADPANAAGAVSEHQATMNLLPCIYLLGRYFMQWAQQLPALLGTPEHPQQQQEEERQTVLRQHQVTLKQHVLAVARHAVGVQRFLLHSSIGAQLAAAGYMLQPVRQQLGSLLDTCLVVVSRGARIGSESVAPLVQQLQSAGRALCTFAVPCLCNNPGCVNMRGLTELSLVSGRSCMCGACKVARYCSRACQKQHWKQHKPVCAALQQRRQQQQ